MRLSQTRRLAGGYLSRTVVKLCLVRQRNHFGTLHDAEGPLPRMHLSTRSKAKQKPSKAKRKGNEWPHAMDDPCSSPWAAKRSMLEKR
jgi:hypothetical protein